MSTCLHCGTNVDQNFCPNCGQRREVKKITWHYLVEEVIHFFTHLEKNFIGSTLKMWANPGLFAKSYLEGHRKDKQPPVSFLVVWAAIFYFTREILVFLFHFRMEEIQSFSFVSPEAAIYYFRHLTYLTVVLTPIWALISWTFMGIFKKINYPEAVLICFYSYGIFFMVLTLITIICSVFRVNILSNTMNNIYTIAAIVNGLWLNYSIMKAYEINFRIIRSMMIILIGSFTMIGFIELITAIFH